MKFAVIQVMLAQPALLSEPKRLQQGNGANIKRPRLGYDPVQLQLIECIPHGQINSLPRISLAPISRTNQITQLNRPIGFVPVKQRNPPDKSIIRASPHGKKDRIAFFKMPLHMRNEILRCSACHRPASHGLRIRLPKPFVVLHCLVDGHIPKRDAYPGD